MEHYSSVKEKGILPFAKVCIVVEGIMLSEISWSEEDKYYIIPLVWNLINKIN